MNRARQALISSALLDPMPASLLQRVSRDLCADKTPLVTAVAGFAADGELAVGACEAVAVVGEALAEGAGEEAWPVSEAVAAGTELAAAEPLWFAVHPATAPASAAQSASLLSVRFTSLETRFARDGCIASIRWPSS